MSDQLDQMIFYGELSAEKADELRRLLASDAEAAAAFDGWRRLRRTIRDRLDAVVHDRELFALYALYARGRADILTEEERKRAEAAAPHFEAALGRHPGLADVAEDVGAAARAFEAMWEDVFADRDRARLARPGSRPPARRSRAVRWTVRSAIGVAAVLFVGLLVLLARQEQHTATVETADGEVQVVDLGEGSSARVLGSSRLTYMPPDGSVRLSRQVQLEGRAFFDVTAADRGFVVRTPNARATVLGTSFGVDVAGAITEVTLAEGRLSLASREDPETVVVLEGGQSARVTGTYPPTAPEPVRVHERLAWTGLFVFASTPLLDILQELGRHYGVQLSADSGLSSERVTGRFDRDQDLEDILDVVAAAVGAEVRQAGPGFHLGVS